MLSFTTDGCKPGHMQFRYNCAIAPDGDLYALLSGTAPDPYGKIPTVAPVHDPLSHSAQLRVLMEDHAAWSADAAAAAPPGASLLGVRPRFSTETVCAPVGNSTLEALEPHTVACPETHGISELWFTGEGCAAGEMHYIYSCAPWVHYLQPLPAQAVGTADENEKAPLVMVASR